MSSRRKIFNLVGILFHLDLVEKRHTVFMLSSNLAWNSYDFHVLHVLMPRKKGCLYDQEWARINLEENSGYRKWTLAPSRRKKHGALYLQIELEINEKKKPENLRCIRIKEKSVYTAESKVVAPYSTYQAAMSCTETNKMSSPTQKKSMR